MQNNTLRIVGGQWRGQKFTFPPIKGVRPTPDRVRETVFNWLMHDTHDARCLDLFSGSGALGLEALSRGAKHVTFVEAHPRMAEQLKHTFQRFDLDYEQALLSQSKVNKWLQRDAVTQFDLVFLDPPFYQHWLADCLQWLEQYQWLSPGALIYVEHERDLLVQGMLPEHWQCRKFKQAGEVGFALLQAPEGEDE